MKHILIVFALVLAGVSTAACPKAPPNLTPGATVAFYQTQVQHAIDVFEDFAIDANKVGLTGFDDATTASIVRWHDTATTIIHNASADWKTQVKGGFDALVNALPLGVKVKLTPYVPLVYAALDAVPA